MTKLNLLFFTSYFLLIGQRLSELWLSSLNRKKLLLKYRLKSVGDIEAKKIKLFHFTWFLCLLLEFLFHGEMTEGLQLLIGGIGLFFAQLLRLLSQLALREKWNVEIIWPQNENVERKGIYRFIRHPNYLAVLIEFIAYPLLFKLYFSALVFSCLELMLLAKRIALEENFLSNVANYQTAFKEKRKCIFF